ncbi:MAG: alpha/beta fold hydrolase [Gammaproteobacteria bacterium]|nr:alpha/beta fold hydrolase [Gammaproteobacteria bacterium]
MLLKKLGKRLRWGAAFLLLTLLLSGAYAYFVGTRALLSQAEAFAFRRMTVPKLEAQEGFRFFYATNRIPGEPAGPLDSRFERNRDTGLKFGLFDTSFEPTLGLGMLLDPSDWFLNEEIRLEGVNTLNRDAFIKQLKSQVTASPHRSLLLVVHGFREAFPSALRKTAFLAHVLDINTPVVVFDWPGDQGSSLRGYRRARTAARASGAELASLIDLLVDEVQPDRLWILANSMGGQVVVDAFHVLDQNATYADSETEIENVVLTAPDVDHEEFNDSFRKEITNLAENVTVYVSSNDRALLASRLINRGLRLGESTLDPGNPGQLKQTQQLAELLEPDDEKLVLVDVTPVNRTRNFHNFSLETPEFFDDLYLRFTNTELPQSRELYFLETPQGVRYFVLTRGR